MSQILPPEQLERIAKLAARTYSGPNKPLRQALAEGWQSEELAWAAVVAVVVAEAAPYLCPAPPEPDGATDRTVRGWLNRSVMMEDDFREGNLEYGRYIILRDSLLEEMALALRASRSSSSGTPE